MLSEKVPPKNGLLPVRYTIFVLDWKSGPQGNLYDRKIELDDPFKHCASHI